MNKNQFSSFISKSYKNKKNNKKTKKLFFFIIIRYVFKIIVFFVI